MNARNPRGQAAVEFALCTLIFVTVLVFGIHFAELGVFKLRVQQAAHSALFDATGARYHNFGGGDPEFTTPHLAEKGGKTAEERAELRYKNFDGLGAGGAGTVTQLFTRASGLNVVCGSDNVARFPLGAPQFNEIRQSYRHPAGGDALSCNARGVIATVNISRDFAERGEGSGFFSQEHATDRMINGITVCGFGRRIGGACAGRVPIAVDDWGLSGSNPNFGEEFSQCGRNCNGGSAGNQAFKRSVGRTYQDYQNNYGHDPVIKNFLTLLMAKDEDMPWLYNTPVQERDLRVIFSGEEPSPDHDTPFGFRTQESFRSFPDAIAIVQHEWEVTPYSGAYKDAYQRREQCFLGSPCDRSLFDKGAW